MLEPQDDVIKRRLVDRAQIAAAVDFLRARGVAAEIIVVQLARHFYVDMDELNAVLAVRERQAHVPAPATPPFRPDHARTSAASAPAPAARSPARR